MNSKFLVKNKAAGLSLALGLVFCLLLSISAQAATLDLGSDSGAPGTDVTIEITLTDPGNNVVAATSNDITFDTTRLENPSCAIGPAGTAADKDVTCGLIPPGVPGMYRVGVFGFNINVIQDGIVAYVTFHIKDSAPSGNAILSNDPSASDAAGGAVVTTGTGGTITVTGGPPPVAAVPTFTEWGMIIIALLMGMTGLFMIRRRMVS